MVSPRGGCMPVDAMVSRIDARTRVVTAPTVTFAPGFRTEIDRVGHARRERGVFFMIDAAQSCGVLRFSLHVYNTPRDIERVLELT
jgi:cysteine desulfurase/selenocysteine lyase